MKKTMAESIIIDTDFEKSMNTSASWNLFLSEETDFSESSRSDGEEIFDDTYSDIENIDNNEIIDNSLINEDNRQFHDAASTAIKSKIINHEIKESLVKRVESLRETICKLKELLDEEHRLWKQEREEYNLIHEKNNVNALEEVTVAAREASKAYVIESMKGIFPSILAHDPSPMKINRNILNNDYYQKLNQVERLCNEELLKIRSEADLLKPLKQMVSQWNISASEDDQKIRKIQ